MLQDENRVTAFRQAIELTVREGMRVLELGGGTGIFSYFAARRGGQVICVERNPELVRLSRQFLADNLPPIASRSCRPMPLSTYPTSRSTW